jgi:hypothetical protein
MHPKLDTRRAERNSSADPKISGRQPRDRNGSDKISPISSLLLTTDTDGASDADVLLLWDV